MTDVIIRCAVVMALLFTAAMLVAVVVLYVKGWKKNPSVARLLLVFIWSYVLSLAVLYSTRMLTGGYSSEDAVMYSILFPLGIVGFWILSSRLYGQNLKQPIGMCLRKD